MMPDIHEEKVSIEANAATWCGLLVILRDASFRYAENRGQDQTGLNICYTLAMSIFESVIVPMEEGDHHDMFVEFFEQIMETDPKWRQIKRNRFNGQENN